MPKFIIKKEHFDKMVDDSREIENRGEDVETLYVLFGKYHTNGIEVSGCEHTYYKKKNIFRKWKLKNVNRKELNKKLEKYMNDSEIVGFFHNHPICDKTDNLGCRKMQPDYTCFSFGDVKALGMLWSQKLGLGKNPMVAAILYCGKTDKNLVCSNYEIFNYCAEKYDMNIKQFIDPEPLELIVI